MSGSAIAAVLLAATALVFSPSPVRRLRKPRPRDVRPVVSIVCVAAVAALAMTARPALVLAALMAAATLAARHRRARATADRRGEGEAIAAAIEVLVGELKVGAHPVAAFSTAGAECGDSVGRALRAVATRAQLGADVSEGLRAMATCSAVPAYWNRLAVFWQLAAEHGLAMSILMRAAHRDIVDRQRFADRMRAALAGARATAVILAALPILGVVLGQLIGADPVSFLLGSRLGGVMLISGVGLMCVGIAWADQIVDRLAG